MYNMVWFTINNCLFKNGLLLPEKLAAAMELKPIEIQKSKTSTTFLKRGKYLKNKSFFCFTYVISKFIFSKLKAFPLKLFLKRLSVSLAFTFIIYGMYLAIHGKVLNSRKSIELVNSHVIIFYVYQVINHIPWLLL